MRELLADLSRGGGDAAIAIALRVIRRQPGDNWGVTARRIDVRLILDPASAEPADTAAADDAGAPPEGWRGAACPLGARRYRWQNISLSYRGRDQLFPATSINVSIRSHGSGRDGATAPRVSISSLRG